MDSLIEELGEYIKKLIQEKEDPMFIAQNVKALAELLTAKAYYESPNYSPSLVSKEQMES